MLHKLPTIKTASSHSIFNCIQEMMLILYTLGLLREILCPVSGTLLSGVLMYKLHSLINPASWRGSRPGPLLLLLLWSRNCVQMPPHLLLASVPGPAGPWSNKYPKEWAWGHCCSKLGLSLISCGVHLSWNLWHVLPRRGNPVVHHYIPNQMC